MLCKNGFFSHDDSSFVAATTISSSEDTPRCNAVSSSMLRVTGGTFQSRSDATMRCGSSKLKAHNLSRSCLGMSVASGSMPSCIHGLDTTTIASRSPTPPSSGSTMLARVQYTVSNGSSRWHRVRGLHSDTSAGSWIHFTTRVA